MVTEILVAIAKAQQGRLFAGLKPGSRYFFSLSGVGRGGLRRAHRCFVLYISDAKNWGGLGLGSGVGSGRGGLRWLGFAGAWVKWDGEVFRGEEWPFNWFYSSFSTKKSFVTTKTGYFFVCHHQNRTNPFLKLETA